MPLKIKLLAAGAATSGSTIVLYTAPSSASGGQGVIVSNVRVVNTMASGSVTVNLYYRPGAAGSLIRLIDRDKSLAAGDPIIVKPELTMTPGSSIEVVTTGNLDYTVFGVERE